MFPQAAEIFRREPESSELLAGFFNILSQVVLHGHHIGADATFDEHLVLSQRFT